ncbi:MAG TPA: DUF3352 domain-containing protein [Cyclobacteriaceae bacterium]|nr:DUF3352 domain-containing protein [Cyclobacteriaceae bacterium]
MRLFKWIIVLAVLGGGGWVAWKFYSSKGVAGEALQLIPDDAVYAIITDDPIETWKQIAGTEAWSHLAHNAYFASLTSSANSLDSLIRDNEMLFDLIGSRSLIVSAHMIGTKDYDFLFLVDLQGASGIKFLNEYVTTFTTGGFTVKKEKYFDHDIVILHDPSDNTNLYISIPGTFLVMSYTKKVLLNALDAQASGATLSKDRLMPVGDGSNSIGKLYLNYYRLPELVRSYSDGENEYVNNLSESLISTNLDIQIDGNLLTAKGFTYVNDSTESYIRTLEVSGKGPTEFFEIAPQRTGFCMAMGFGSFSTFFQKFQDNISKDVKEYKEYRDNMTAVESYLKIDLQKQLIDWIGEEVAFLELQSSGKGTDTEMAVILKANNIEKARKDLADIERQVRKRTPVKFKSIDHRGFPINYLGMKGVFKVLLGKFFARYDKPYYTIINNFVVFSNHPQTLESMIDDYLDHNTLDRSAEFKQFRRKFEDESAVFMYISTPALFNTMKGMADVETRTSMQNNKPYITCFRHIGFQMVPDGGKFITLMVEQFEVMDSLPKVATIEAVEAVDDEVPITEDTVDIEVIETETDPMALPYIYVKNLNARSFTDYYEDSTVHFKVEIRNGFKDGSFTEYYQNGEEKMTGKFKGDKRDGHWRLYNEDGDLVMRRVYDNGQVKRERD